MAIYHPPRGHLQEQRLRRLRGNEGEGGVAECRAQGICIKKLNTYPILYDISYDFFQIVLSISFFNSIIYIFVVSTFFVSLILLEDQSSARFPSAAWPLGRPGPLPRPKAVAPHNPDRASGPPGASSEVTEKS